MSASLGLGTAALGRPGYVTLGHAADLSGDYDPAAMEAHSQSVLDVAFGAGVRYFDAARSYGRAEEFVASWLAKRQIRPDDVVIASKWGYTYTAGWSTNARQHEVKDHSLATFTRQLAESIERLDGYLSLYQIHSVTAESKTLDDDTLIDAIAGLREKGIRAGLTVSGAGQAIAIRRSLSVTRDGERVFDSVQATWNLLERGAESALRDAHDAGMKVVVKEALANGRLTHANRDPDQTLGPLIADLRAIAEERRITIEMVAVAAALARPWADYIVSGAATVDQMRASLAARDLYYDTALDDQLKVLALDSEQYWRLRSTFEWN